MPAVPTVSASLAAALTAHFAPHAAGARVPPMAIRWCSACAEPIEPDAGCPECAGVGWRPAAVRAFAEHDAAGSG
jgi:hypothetical protein